MKIISVGVHKDGPSGFSAWCYDDEGNAHRLSPSWLRDVKIDTLQEFEAPSRNDKKRLVKIKRMAPFVTGQKVVVGESLVAATERAKRALELLAVGKALKIPPKKEAA